MKNFLTTLFTFIVCSTYAQVGIGITDPKATLDVVASNQATPTNKDGVLIPRVNAFPITNPGADQDAMFLYLTTASGASVPGFYYWNNGTTKWLPFGGGNPGWELLGNTGTNSATNFLGTTDAVDLTFRTENKERLKVTTQGQLEFLNSEGLNAIAINSSIFIGKDAGENFNYATFAANNIYIGKEAGFTNVFRSDNIAIGTQASKLDALGSNTIALGSRALSTSTQSNYSIAIGSGVMAARTNSSYNVALGHRAMSVGNTGDFNTSLGADSGRSTIGDNSVFVGYKADEFNEGNQNVVLGSNAGYTSFVGPSYSGRVLIGYNAWKDQSGENLLAIENSNSPTPLLYGEFDNDILRVNGQLQVGSNDDATNAIVYAFPVTDGTSGQVLTTDGSGVVSWGAGGASSSDADWFENGSTTAPNAIGDNMFTNGSVSIGNTTADAGGDLDISNTGDTLVIVEADSDNSGENDSPEIRLVQDGGDGSSIMLEGTGGNTVPGTAANSLLLVTRSGQSGAPIHIAANSVLGATVKSDGQLQLNQYTTATSFTGTPIANLQVDAAGNIIQKALTSGAWDLLGNTGTNPGTNFLGTTDAVDLTFRTENKERLRVTQQGQLEFINNEGLNATAINSSIFIGKDAGENFNYATYAANNIYIGKEAGFTNVFRSDNIAIGTQASKLDALGSNSIAIGSSALSTSTESNYCVAIGSGVMAARTNSSFNVGLGHRAMSVGNTGDFNTSIGADSGRSTLGDNSVFLGYKADEFNEGSQNVVLGSNAGYTGVVGPSYSGRVLIGYNAWNEKAGENLLVIENSDSKTPLIGGDFANDKLAINVDLTTINTSSSTLTVGGDVTATNYIATVGGFGSGYADYVFQDYFTGSSIINSDYKFMTLEKAMAFVKENGHLPNVKSYEEIKANNFQYDLGATSLKNLEKIEENFLYVSELKTEIDTLKKESKGFKTEIDILKEENKALRENVAEILRLLKADKTN